MTKIQISKWGNSSAIRLPKAALDELGLKQGDTVDLTVENGKAIIEPARPQKITLE
jgi:antitoxin MazE